MIRGLSSALMETPALLQYIPAQPAKLFTKKHLITTLFTVTLVTRFIQLIFTIMKVPCTMQTLGSNNQKYACIGMWSGS